MCCGLRKLLHFEGPQRHFEGALDLTPRPKSKQGRFVREIPVLVENDLLAAAGPHGTGGLGTFTASPKSGKMDLEKGTHRRVARVALSLPF